MAGLMVMTSGFQPGDRGSIPLAGENIFYSILIHIFNLVPNSQSAGYLSFQFTVGMGVGGWSRK